tara:strand:+ start:438 stop:2210 length:1773 start_codon:yes stop_codon:yes gene_type:complete
MATKVDELVVEIKAETKGLRQGLDSVNKKLNTTNKTAKASVLTFGNLAKVFAVIGFARLGGQIVKTSREFQDLEATLRAITGGAEGAAVSMELVRKFTMGTTFQLQNVSTAFTTLLNAGIAPTSETLKDFGNLAAAFGKDITQVAQATFNATTGETEMLKQLGIKAKLEGDKMTMIFRERETVIDRSSTEIVKYLRNIAKENFDTALEERLNTVSGVFSNLGDMFAETFNAIGEGGLNEALTDTGKNLLAMGETAKNAGTIIGRLLLKAFQLIGSAANLVAANMRLLLTVLGIYVSFKAPVVMTMVFAKSMKVLTQSIAAARAAMTLFGRNKLMTALSVSIVAVAAFTDVFDGLGKTLSKFTSQLSKELGLNELFTIEEGTTKSVEELDAEIEKMVANMKGLTTETKAIKGLSGAFEEMKPSIIEATQAFTTSFVDGIMDGKNALSQLADFAKNIVSQMISTFLQLAVVNQILNAAFGLTGKTALPTMSFGGKAGGGTVQAGQPTLVGERGAELFVPNSSGRIVNNANSQGMGGGGGTVIHQSINFATGVVPTVRAEVMKMMPQIAAVTKGAVAESAMRGGSYRKALVGG